MTELTAAERPDPMDEWARWGTWKKTFGHAMLLAAVEWAFMLGQWAEATWHIKHWFGL